MITDPVRSLKDILAEPNLYVDVSVISMLVLNALSLPMVFNQ